LPLKEDVFHELFYVSGRSGVFAGEDDDLALEAVGDGEALEAAGAGVEGEDALGDEADALTEGDEVDDEVEVVDFGGFGDEPVFLFEPSAEGGGLNFKFHG
jgi:hypothetical protein